MTGSSSSGGDGTSSGTSGTTSSSSGGTSGSSSTSSGAAGVCGAPKSNPSDSLPFAVDESGAFIPSGYEGDYSFIAAAKDTTCGGNRSSADAAGTCHTFTYSLGSEGGEGAGWAGVVWQYPVNNWGAQPGYGIPAGATSVAFSVRGATGEESVSFNAGGIGFGSPPSPSAPCVDTVMGSVPKMTLGTTWTKVTIPLSGEYAGGVLNGFAWVAGKSDQPASATEVTFYVDDIQWTM